MKNYKSILISALLTSCLAFAHATSANSADPTSCPSVATIKSATNFMFAEHETHGTGYHAVSFDNYYGTPNKWDFYITDIAAKNSKEALEIARQTLLSSLSTGDTTPGYFAKSAEYACFYGIGKGEAFAVTSGN